MEPDDYKRLVRATRSAGKNAAWPFVPWVGNSYWKAQKRVMIVGKAIAWNPKKLDDVTGKPTRPPKSLRDAQAWTKRVIGKVSRPEQPYRSDFWRHAKALVESLADPDPDKPFTDYLVWSNVMKVGQEGSNPKAALRDAQRTLCVELLLREIRELKPHCVALVTSDYEADLVEALFRPWRKRGELWMGQCGTSKVFWTPHPQGWSSDKRDGALKAIIKTCG